MVGDDEEGWEGVSELREGNEGPRIPQNSQ